MCRHPAEIPAKVWHSSSFCFCASGRASVEQNHSEDRELDKQPAELLSVLYRVGSGSCNHFPSSVVGSSWVSRANINVLLALLERPGRVAPQRMSAASALAAAASQQLLWKLQTGVPHVRPDDPCCAGNIDEDPWAEWQWRACLGGDLPLWWRRHWWDGDRRCIIARC